MDNSISKIEKFKQFSIISLANGLKTLIYPRNELNSVGILAIVRAGHLCEEVKHNGIAHLLEHMLFDGTERFPTFKELNAFFDKIAGELTGATSFDFVTAGGIFVDEELENALLALDQVLFHPLLTQEHLRKEKGIVMDETSSLIDNNDYLNYIETKRARFKGKSILTEPIIGTPKSLKNIEIRHIRNFHNKYFKPENIKLVIVGKLNPLKTRKILEKIFNYPNSQTPLKHKRFSYSQFSDQNILLSDRKSEKAYLRMTFPAYSRKDKSLDRVALAYLCSLLANRRDSLLYSRLREEKGWIYDINCQFFVSFDIGALEIVTSTPINKFLEVIEEILKSIKQVKTKKFDQKFFERVKDIDKKKMKMVFDTPDGILDWFSEEMSYRYPKIFLPHDLIQIYDKLTTEDIKRVANKIFDLSKINICTLQPFDNLDKKRYKEEIDRLISKYN